MSQFECNVFRFSKRFDLVQSTELCVPSIVSTQWLNWLMTLKGFKGMLILLTLNMETVC